MSHFERITTNIKNIDHLKEALDTLGYEYQTGSAVTVRGYGNKTQKVDLVVTLPGSAFQIGFARNAHGNYEMVADWYLSKGSSDRDFSRRVEKEIGNIEERIRREILAETNRIKREIARKKVLESLNSLGCTMVEEKNENNEVFLHMRRLV